MGDAKRKKEFREYVQAIWEWDGGPRYDASVLPDPEWDFKNVTLKPQGCHVRLLNNKVKIHWKPFDRSVDKLTNMHNFGYPNQYSRPVTIGVEVVKPNYDALYQLFSQDQRFCISPIVVFHGARGEQPRQPVSIRLPWPEEPPEEEVQFRSQLKQTNAITQIIDGGASGGRIDVAFPVSFVKDRIVIHEWRSPNPQLSFICAVTSSAAFSHNLPSFFELVYKSQVYITMSRSAMGTRFQCLKFDYLRQLPPYSADFSVNDFFVQRLKKVHKTVVHKLKAGKIVGELSRCQIKDRRLLYDEHEDPREVILDYPYPETLERSSLAYRLQYQEKEEPKGAGSVKFVYRNVRQQEVDDDEEEFDSMEEDTRTICIFRIPEYWLGQPKKQWEAPREESSTSFESSSS